MRSLVTAEARAAQDPRSHKVTGCPALFLGVFLSPCVPAGDRDSSCGQLLSSSEEVRIEADGMLTMIQTQLPDTEPGRKKPGYLVQRNDGYGMGLIRHGLAYEWTGRTTRCQLLAAAWLEARLRSSTVPIVLEKRFTPTWLRSPRRPLLVRR